MSTATLTNAQARRFLLRHQGLVGEPVFEGKQGVLDYVRQAGCIQFDPIDVCGKNPELVLQSRVSGFTKAMLDELLYKDRLLVDYFDKQLAIIPVEDWPYFARDRVRFGTMGRSHDAVEGAADAVRAILRAQEYVSSADLDMDEKVDWYWSDTRLSRAVLESLYFRGELAIHHKKGSNKHYSLAENLLPADVLQAENPLPSDEDFRDWQVLRRIGAVGMLWNRASDAFLGASFLKDGGRAAAFANLLGDGLLTEVRVEGINGPMYIRTSEVALLDGVLAGEAYAPRMELLAPLDCFMWDRKLIRALFDFAYTWEIYTPAVKRQYGYYVLPIVWEERLVGRVEAVADRKAAVLRVNGVWWEARSYKGELRKCLRRFARFNGCKTVEGL